MSMLIKSNIGLKSTNLLSYELEKEGFFPSLILNELIYMCVLSHSVVANSF